MVSLPLAGVTFDGWNDTYNYTELLTFDGFRPVGWCAQHEQQLSPPGAQVSPPATGWTVQSGSSNFPAFDWRGYLAQTGSTAVEPALLSGTTQRRAQAVAAAETAELRDDPDVSNEAHTRTHRAKDEPGSEQLGSESEDEEEESWVGSGSEVEEEAPRTEVEEEEVDMMYSSEAATQEEKEWAASRHWENLTFRKVFAGWAKYATGWQMHNAHT